MFEVDSVGAGDVRAQETIFSAASSASCGFEFTEGKRYVVFACLGDERDPTAEPGRLNASLCSNTRAIGDEQLPFLDDEPLALTESEAAGEDKTDAVTFWDVAPIAVGIALVGVAAVALFASRRRRRSPSNV